MGSRLRQLWQACGQAWHKWGQIWTRFALWQVAALLPPIAQTFGKEQVLGQLAKMAVIGLITAVWAASWPILLIGLRPRPVSIIMMAANLLMVAFVAISAFHLVVYDQLPGVSSIYAIADTSPQEAAGFFALLSRPSAWLASLVVAALVLALGLLCRASLRAAQPAPTLAMRVAALLVLIGIPTALAKENKFLLNNPFTFTLHVGREVLSYRAELMFVTRGTPSLLRTKVKASDRPAKHLLIVGESLTPTHMATCGYSRNTTPEIDKARDYQRVVLCDACSTKSNTARALMDVMTAHGRFDEQPFLQRPNLISTLQRNAYQVYWISNQTLRSGPDDSMVAVWSTFADQRWFTNLEGYQYDTSVLPRVEAALRGAGDRKVVLVHVEGSHPPYFLRYPASFERWPEQAEVPETVPRRDDPAFERAPYNQYDNAVLHSDHLLGRLLELAKKYDVSTVTYFSDHGQNLGETSPHLGHSLDEGPRQGFTVPVIFWLSDDAAVGPEQRTRLNEHAKQPFQTDQLFASLLDLYGISTDEPALANSLLSPNYHPVERFCDQMR